jgi:uncharacterized membrane protein
MQTTLDIVSVLLIGLLIGAELAVAAFVNPVLAQIGGAAEAQATRLFARKLGAFMPFWYGACLLLIGALGVLRRHDAGLDWIFSSAALWVLVIVLTLLFLVPINNRIAAMDPTSFSPALRRQHTRWDRLHRGRVALLALAMLFLLIGMHA